MSHGNTPTRRSEERTVSLNLELAYMESALRGTSLLAELLASNGLPDEEARQQAPLHGGLQQLAVALQLPQVRVVQQQHLGCRALSQ